MYRTLWPLNRQLLPQRPQFWSISAPPYSYYEKSPTGNVLSDLWTAGSSHHIPNFGPFLLRHTPWVDGHLLTFPHHLEKRIFFDIFIGNLPVKSRISLTYNLFCNLMKTLNDYSVFTNLIPPIAASDTRGYVSLGYLHTNNFTRAFLLFRLRFYKTFYCTPHVSII